MNEKNIATEWNRTDAANGAMEIDLWELALLYLRRWRLLAVCCILAAALALAYTLGCVTPLYRASITVYVNSVKNSQQIDYVSASNLATSQQLVNTYVNIIRSDTVLEKVIEQAELSCTAKDLRAMMTAEQVDETELFTVYISHPDPEMAAKIANAVAQVAPGEIEGFVDGSSTKIIDYAKVPQARYSPSYKKNVLLGGMLGGVLAVAYVTAAHLLDVRIKREEDLERLFDLPVLGQIPAFEDEKKKEGGK